MDSVDPSGDRHIETFERKKEADDHWATVKVDVRKGVHIAPSKSPTVAEAADKWLKKVEANGMRDKGPVRRSTLAHYRQHVNLHIVPRIGRTKLSALNVDRVAAFRDELLKELSRPLARKVLVSFRSLLKASRYAHVADDVSIGGGKSSKMEAGRDFPKRAEITRLLAAAKDNPKSRALLLILAFTGLRASEFRGLRWSDVDLDACELHVRQRVDEYNVVGAPKSNSSERTIPLDPTVMVPALKEWKIKCPPSEGDFVFPTRTGQPQDYNGIVRGSLDPIMKRAHIVDKDGEPKYTPHAFRHFFASWCINSKARGGRELPPKQAQYLLGHSTISMTFDIYGHMFPSDGNRDELTAAVRQLLA